VVSVVGVVQAREGKCAIEEDRRGTRTRHDDPQEKSNLPKAEDLTTGQLRRAVFRTRQKLATSQRRTCRVIGLARRGSSAAAIGLGVLFIPLFIRLVSHPFRRNWFRCEYSLCSH